MKLVESYCRGQVSLYCDKLTDGSFVYYVQTCGSAFIPVRSLESGIALCEAFKEHTV